MTDFIIETRQLCKSFKSQPALQGLDRNLLLPTLVSISNAANHGDAG